MNMKVKTTLTLMLVMLVALAAHAAPRGDARFETTTIDMGVIKENGGAKSATFHFTNIGDGNLVITAATAQCGCTRPEYSEAPVAPGKRGTVKVTYNPKGRPGAFTKSITVRMAGAKKGKTVLKIKGTVQP